MKYTVIEPAGFEFTFTNALEAFEMVEYIRGYIEADEIVRIEVE